LRQEIVVVGIVVEDRIGISNAVAAQFYFPAETGHGSNIALSKLHPAIYAYTEAALYQHSPRPKRQHVSMAAPY
jgi:hypothetical protein